MDRQAVFRVGDKTVFKYRLTDKSGMQAEILNLGAAVYSLKVQDKYGAMRDVVLGYKDIHKYIQNPLSFGAVVGRCANRISGGAFFWDGKKIQLEKNEGENHLHGGSKGFSTRIWETALEKSSQEQGSENGSEVLCLSLLSKDGDSGYPGEIFCSVKYSLTGKGGLVIEYFVSSHENSVANLTNHSYFNLNGEGRGSCEDHEIQIFSDAYTEIDSDLIPTGKILEVQDTPMDFRKAKRLGKDIDSDFKQLKTAGGYDHNYVLKKCGSDLFTAAKAYSPESGIVMTVKTNSPGMQFYSGNNFGEGCLGKGGNIYRTRSGICFETQFFPDALNRPEFEKPFVSREKAQHFITEFSFDIFK